MSGGRRDGWLGAATGDGGLVIPGRPARRAADLRLLPSHVEVGPPAAAVVLDWADHDSTEPLDERSGDAWQVSRWSETKRREAIGVGLIVAGRYVDATADLRRSTQTWRHRLHRSLQPGVAVPLWPVGLFLASVDRPLLAMKVVCTLLAQRPELRPRLADWYRTKDLLRDLDGLRTGMPADPVGVLRTSSDIFTAMRLVGYRHPFFGRPLPGDEVPDLDEATARVLARVQANPYPRGTAISEERVRTLVDRYYVGVEAWPLQALLDD